MNNFDEGIQIIVGESLKNVVLMKKYLLFIYRKEFKHAALEPCLACKLLFTRQNNIRGLDFPKIW